MESQQILKVKHRILKKEILAFLFKYLKHGNYSYLNKAFDYWKYLTTDKIKDMEYADYIRTVCCHDYNKSTLCAHGKLSDKDKFKDLRQKLFNQQKTDSFDHETFLNFIQNENRYEKENIDLKQQKPSIVRNSEILEFITKNPVDDGLGKFGKPQDKYRYNFFGCSSMEYDIWRNGE